MKISGMAEAGDIKACRVLADLHEEAGRKRRATFWRNAARDLEFVREKGQIVVMAPNMEYAKHDLSHLHRRTWMYVSGATSILGRGSRSNPALAVMLGFRWDDRARNRTYFDDVLGRMAAGLIRLFWAPVKGEDKGWTDVWEETGRDDHGTIGDLHEAESKLSSPGHYRVARPHSIISSADWIARNRLFPPKFRLAGLDRVVHG